MDSIALYDRLNPGHIDGFMICSDCIVSTPYEFRAFATIAMLLRV